MAYCIKCGAELGEDARFCSQCGVPSAPKEKGAKGVFEEMQVAADDLVKTVKGLIKEGNVRRITVKNEKGDIVMDIPVTVGAVGALLAPWLAALGAIAAVATNCTILIVRRE